MKQKRKRPRNEPPLTRHRIFALRKTLIEVAADAGVSIATLSAMENGDRMPLPKRWRAIAEAYQVPERKLLRLAAAGRVRGQK